MKKISLHAGAGSTIMIENGLAANLTAGKLFKERDTVFIVTDENVGPLYLDRVCAGSAAAGCTVHSHVFPAGEGTKSFDSLLELYGLFHGSGLDRGSIVAALGGGVIGDLAGFAAATYMRGTRFVQVPTTLLAQVDASIGGKVAVNHLGMKNYVGTFYQPETVAIDPETLATLPEVELRNGLAEVVKAAVIADLELFQILENSPELPALPPPDLLEEMIFRAAGVKVKIVEQDERESGLRRVLNFGHTIGHALEELPGAQKPPHGAAVAAGMALETRLAVKLGIAEKSFEDRLENLLRKLGFKLDITGIDATEALQLMSMDKKSKKQNLVFALPAGFGKMQVVEDIEPSLVRAVIEEAPK